MIKIYIYKIENKPFIIRPWIFWTGWKLNYQIEHTIIKSNTLKNLKGFYDKDIIIIIIIIII
jgi:hypothetical protein